MSYALWLNGVKVYSAKAIPDNFDLISLKGYLSGGCLLSWLYENDGKEYADKLMAVKDSAWTDEVLYDVFGVAVPSESPMEAIEETPPVSEVHLNSSYYHSFFQNSFIYNLSSLSNSIIRSFYGSGFHYFSSMSGSYYALQTSYHFSQYNSKAIHIVLSSCPLNRYGYGIHNI